MVELDKLWEYQLTELAVEEYENKLKNTETRKKLVQLQKFLQGSQSKLLSGENVARVKQDKISNLESQLKEDIKELEDLNKDLSYYSECDIEDINQNDIQEFVKNCEKVSENIGSIKKQISKLKSDVDKADKEAKDILQKMRKAKKEFDELKAKHLKELEAGSQDLTELRVKMEAAAKNVDPQLMEKYKKIKGIRPNPVAILSDARCGGCNMQLPSGITQIVKNADTVVLCENCGRILYIQDK